VGVNDPDREPMRITAMAGRRVVLITGASSGIGRALAGAYLRQDAIVGVCGRDRNRVASVCAGRVNARPLIFDTRNREAATQAVKEFDDETGGIDLAILNAGTHQATDAAHFDAAVFADVMAVNYGGLVNCLQPVLAGMKSRRRGQIALMGSVAGFCGLPNAGAYCASKSAIMRLAESLRVELAAVGIDIRLVLPGFVDTPLTQKNDFPMPFLMDVEAAAERIHRGLEGRRFEIAFPRRLVWLMRLLSILPRPLFFLVTKRLLPANRAI
jgi:NAD(P)-dependent dehydrogenase (short-subunit alcohol dehydrogenase family)